MFSSIAFSLLAALLICGVGNSEEFRFPKEKTLFSGEKCSLGGGQSGTCRRLSECPSEVARVKRWGEPRTLCHYDEFMPIVCCEERKFESRFKRPRKSVKKCWEYRDLINDPVVRNDAYQLGRTARIIQGDAAFPGEFPHMAAIGWTLSDGSVDWRCGGSLISENFVLTAAHCTVFQKEEPDIVRIGDRNLLRTGDEDFSQDFRIEKIISHPECIASSRYHDIALIKLVGKVKFGRNIRPACLYAKKNVYSKCAWVTGYGQIDINEGPSGRLFKAELEFVDLKTCRKIYGVDRRIDKGIMDHQICAGDRVGQKDTCQGDSGGPLQVRSGDVGEYIYHIVGVTSFGQGCAIPNVPGIYTRVSSHIDWIENNVWGD